MLSRTILSMSALALAGALFTAPAAAQSAAHHDHAAHAAHASHDAKPQLPAQRWATDAPLRAGMRNMQKDKGGAAGAKVSQAVHSTTDRVTNKGGNGKPGGMSHDSDTLPEPPKVG